MALSLENPFGKSFVPKYTSRVFFTDGTTQDNTHSDYESAMRQCKMLKDIADMFQIADYETKFCVYTWTPNGSFP